MTFVIKKVVDNIYIFSGASSSGSSIFARSIQNAMVVDDVDHYHLVEVIYKAVESFKIGDREPLKDTRVQKYDDNDMLIFVTNVGALVETMDYFIKQALTKIKEGNGK